MKQENVIKTDILVIGGGIAGCFAAIKAREQGLNVTIVDKGYAGKSGASIGACRSWMVFNTEWGLDYDACMNAFTTEGEYINHREWDEIILKESLSVYQELISWGVRFPADSMKYVKEFPPFGNTRLIYREHAPALRRQAEKVGAKVIDRTMITDLLKQDGRIVGAVGFMLDSCDLIVCKAKTTILTAGSNSFRPIGYPISGLTGDPEGMAYRAGAEITGKEFLTTHSSMAQHFSWKAILDSPGFLTHFTDAEGKRYVGFVNGSETGIGFEPDLSTEFVIHAGKGPLYWDYGTTTPADMEAIRIHQQTYGAKAHDPKIRMAGGASAGYADVGTAGIWTINTSCATSLAGLYTAGDCGGTRHNGSYNCNTGLGTCPSAVTGRRAGMGAAVNASQTKMPEKIDESKLAKLKEIVYTPMERKSGFSPRWVAQLLQNTMMPYFVLHIKQGQRLQSALTIVEFLRDHLVPKLMAADAHELRLVHETKNMVLNAEMILRSSLFRTESRGTHYREDYPRRDDPAWLAWTKIKEENGKMGLSKEPIPKDWWPDLSQSYERRYPRRFPGE